MDKTQLTTIVISAVAGAIAKELIGWTISAIKSLSLIPTGYEKLRAFFRGRNGDILINLINLAFYVGVLVYFVLLDSPISRFEILLVVGAMFFTLFFVISLLWNIYRWREERSKRWNIDQDLQSGHGQKAVSRKMVTSIWTPIAQHIAPNFIFSDANMKNRFKLEAKLMIAIPVLIIILGIVAAIVLPHFLRML
jgi:hypothetical protein